MTSGFGSPLHLLHHSLQRDHMMMHGVPPQPGGILGGPSSSSSSSGGIVTMEALEMAGRNVEKMIHSDTQFPQLIEKLRIGVGGVGASISGLQEPDYPALQPGSTAPEVASLRQMSTVRRVPLPAELVEHFGHMQCNCMMGLFPQIERAWLTIDSDIYVWRFEDTSDLAYFDGLSDTILSVAMLTPKKDIFQPHIKYLLCLTTAVEIILLGVSFTKVDGDEHGEMHLLPEPLFSLPTDSTFMVSIAGSVTSGRIFMGGKDGCLYEFSYKAEDGWFGKKAQKINHSTSTLSFLVPSFVNAALYEEDAIEQIVVDDTRNALYTRSEKGVLQVFDLGYDGMQLTKVVTLSQQSIVQEASRIAVNIDRSNLFPIIGISALPVSESVHLCLVAVSANGVRYFFSTSGSNNPDERPRNLILQHVRLPPGFAASSPVPKPSNVHICYYKQGTLLLTSSQNDDTDVLWLLSSDSFPFQNLLMECQSTIPLDGRVWALAEIPQSERMLRLYRDSFGSHQPPLAVIQHAQTARKFVLISAHGTHIVTKLRPVDHLRQLLIEHGGPDNDVIKAFFGLHSDVQAAATCLVLACSQSLQDTQISQWATRAFFLHGGEPQMLFPHQQQRPVGGQGPPLSPSFMPQLASTPGPAGSVGASSFSFGPRPEPQWGSGGGAGVFSVQQTPMMPEMHFSAKHNGLYLYFSRLIRPVWLATLVVPTDGSKKDASSMSSTVASEEIDWIIVQLGDLRAFLERNAQFTAATSASAVIGTTMSMGLDSAMANLQQKSQQDALIRERQSLLFLQSLVLHCRQVLGLWKVVCDHQFHVVAATLSPDDQNMLRGMYFRDLMISNPGRELCHRLVQAVIQLYLSDNASTDAISNRLRDVCPTLYNDEDAISSKAHEMLIAARTVTQLQERERLLKGAVAMCKDIVGSRVNLEILASHLSAVHCYTGVVELCLAAASKRDPQGLGLHFYKNGEPIEDQQGMQAFLTRMSCYKHVLEMICKLLDTSSSHPLSPNVPRGPGPPPPSDPSTLPPAEAGEYAEGVIKVALSSDDHLFHVAFYQWLVDQGQFERLLAIRSPFVEDFLTRGTKKQPDSVIVFDLLWKYYEKTRSYAAAAKILSKLADRHSNEINLNQRLEYLSRAIMCVKSGEVGGESSRVQVGELLHDLEEKMEVARVQLQIVDALVAKAQLTGEHVSGALGRLNSELMDISQLYQTYAEPFDLWECQLAIFHCAGHHDPMLVETMWSNIIDSELRRSEALPVNSKVTMMSNKIKSLGKSYVGSLKYFPLEFIVRKLELFSCQVKADHTWVFTSFLTVGISLPKLLDTYNRLYVSNDSSWLTKGSPNHLLYVLAKILETFADSPSSVNYNERRQFTVLCLDVVGQYLGNLYTKHDSHLLVQEFRGIQAKLERL